MDEEVQKDEEKEEEIMVENEGLKGCSVLVVVLSKNDVKLHDKKVSLQHFYFLAKLNIDNFLGICSTCLC